MQRVRILFMIVTLFLFLGTTYSQHQVGRATYYAKKFHGRKTSSGIRYHRDSLTCAHRSYPFGTVLKVHNLSTGKDVYVTVTDRMYSRTSSIDLSYAAAKEIGMIGNGYARVEISKCENGVRVPYQDKSPLQMPSFEVQDPLGDGYCLLSEWNERNQKKILQRAVAQSNRRAKQRVGVRKLKTDSVPRWKVFSKLCASTEAADNDNLLLVK